MDWADSVYEGELDADALSADSSPPTAGFNEQQILPDGWAIRRSATDA